jgi:hypothetical protein
MASQSGSSGKQIDTGDLEVQRRRSLSQLIHNSKHPVGRAFKKLGDAGCDPRWLERTLLGLKKFPFGRSEKLTRRHAEQFWGVVQGLESAAGKLERLPDIAFYSLPRDLLPGNWPRGLVSSFTTSGDHDRAELTELLRMLSTRLKDILNTPWRFRSSMASDFLPHFIERIRESTNGKPHWAETATLVGAAYGIYISPQHLKLFARSPSRTK